MGQVTVLTTPRANPTLVVLAWSHQLLMQSMSYGLTQYDVEELVEYCGGKCVHYHPPLVSYLLFPTCSGITLFACALQSLKEK